MALQTAEFPPGRPASQPDGSAADQTTESTWLVARLERRPVWNLRGGVFLCAADRLLISGDHSIGQTIQGRPERSCATVSSVEVIRLGEIAPLAKHGGNRKPEHGQGDNITLTQRGTDTEYTLRRLKRDTAANHFQIDVEVIGSLPASGQWLIEIPGR